MIAYVKINDYNNEKAICVPVNFVQNNKDGKYIYIVTQKNNQSIATRRPVKLGMDYNGTTEILEGISAGDKIITAGFQSLNEGSLISF